MNQTKRGNLNSKIALVLLAKACPLYMSACITACITQICNVMLYFVDISHVYFTYSCLESCLSVFFSVCYHLTQQPKVPAS